jgi:hypothetical protein
MRVSNDKATRLLRSGTLHKVSNVKYFKIYKLKLLLNNTMYLLFIISYYQIKINYTIMSDFNINIQNLKFESMEVGRLIKSSKCIYTWEMTLDDSKRKIELIHSRITGKRRIFLDGKTIQEAQKYTYEFTHTFTVGNHYLNLIQIAPDLYELKIDNITFTTLINRQNREKLKKFKSDQTQKLETFKKSDKSDKLKKAHISNKYEKELKNEDDFFENKFSEDYIDDNKVSDNKNMEDNEDFFDKKEDWDFGFENHQSNSNAKNHLMENFDFMPDNSRKTNDYNTTPNFDLFNKSNNNSYIKNKINSDNINLINVGEKKPTGNGMNLIDMNDIFGANSSNHNTSGIDTNTKAINMNDNNLIDLNFNGKSNLSHSKPVRIILIFS